MTKRECKTRSERRRLLKMLGLGAGSWPLLRAAGVDIVGHALGATAPRRCAIIVAVGEGMPITQPHGLVPQGIAADGPGDYGWGAAESADFTWPSLFEPLAPFRSRSVILDGLYLNVGVGSEIFAGVQHGAGFGLLSGIRPTGNSPEYGGDPAAESLDQYFARKIGTETPVASIHMGFQGDVPEAQTATAFASGAGKPIAHIGSPSLFHSRMFGKGGGMATVDPSEAPLRASLLSSMRDDIKRLQSNLAGEEKSRLDTYLQAVDSYEKKQKQLADLGGGAACMPAAPPAAMDEGPAETRLEQMMQMATVGLRCGLTNVVGVSLGLGFGHDDLVLLKKIAPGYSGHDESAFARTMNGVYRYLGKLLADVLTGIGPVADQTTMMIVSGHGALDLNHHTRMERCSALVFDGTNTLKTGGRYVRYPNRAYSLVDLYNSLSHAVGAPTATFGMGGLSPIKGKIPALH